MAKFRQHPKTLELIPLELWDQLYSGEKVDIHILPDIQPYKSMIDGSLITSRSKHRQHLKDHGCVEVGNDSLATKAQRKPLTSPPGLKETLIREFNKRGL